MGGARKINFQIKGNVMNKKTESGVIMAKAKQIQRFATAIPSCTTILRSISWLFACEQQKPQRKFNQQIDFLPLN